VLRDDDVTGLLLAGGQGRRMGGIDKGLVELAGRPMVAHVLDRLAPQVAAVLVSANRNLDAYAAFGHPVVADDAGEYPGPLAGFAAGLARARTGWIVTAPCDSPLIPRDLVRRLRRTQAETDADIVSAHDGERLQPVFSLLRRDLAGSLAGFMSSGGRKIDQWFALHVARTADFGDCPGAFENVNRPEDRTRILEQLTRGDASG
jgi:molybdopterin-guanine dinucleotide biosynthesis protein A